MFRTISNFMRVSDIRNKIIFTLLMLIVFRIGTFIPVPSVNTDVLKLQDELNAFGVLNIFGGGALQNFSIFAMGVMPYITASIIVQLLQMDVVPKFTEWSKQGEVGRRKLAQFTRYFTVVLGFIQALGMSYGFNNLAGGMLIRNPGIGTYLLIAVVLTAGTAFLMWLGEQITAKGVGNGISIIIFAGIVSGIPTVLNQIYAQQFENVGEDLFLRIVRLLLVALAVIAVIVGVIYIQQAFRKIPIQYAKRLEGRSPVGGHSTHLPLKVNPAGVIPVIFAISFLIAPPTIASFFGTNDVTLWIRRTFDYTHPIGMTIYVVLIIAFTYFYAFVQVNPEQMAENLKKQGGYIPGIRPGKNTQEYVTRILYRLTLVGSVFLAVIAVLPVFFVNVANLPPSAQIGGTSLLIVVGVALETMKQLESQLVKRHYRGFIK
ncbi:preprotein translocase subunit SecY [Anoxybacillus geothermalis]|uniref:preprotein translocase subunit SecY n=1 Tax=Geobacillus stearothermophilus TaxID=1422 RepID=UPI0007AB6D3A|nr:preprotein translocase subunit SecY [Geobacillus stearothermophilus]MED4876498.1 preprotein translocase subunit SecY [Anoxybacillus geothermalis]KZE96698.1 Protein translocase subunit SecY [Geobacillus stearothermophilus]MCK7605108.1 preprotein translocase subunit SecY [Geobacillus stearothermophilus]MED4299572.1 preprotein translocase subunit SecY [Geobacillus stearothermophilus]MED4923725.1 preprotein translocase subunit SecY [Anoxybacillus geothermalis]